MTGPATGPPMPPRRRWFGQTPSMLGLLHSRVVPARTRTGPAVRSVEVISGDGTRLQAWTNDVDRTMAPDTPTVLLCNGLGTNPWCWPALLVPDPGVRVVSWYHRGTGDSARPEDRHRVGIEVFVEDALAVMDAFGLDACPVMGWSMGVNTAFELAYLHPERVTGLLAVGGVPGGTFSSMLGPLHVPRMLRSGLTVNLARAFRLLGRPASLVSQRIGVNSAGMWALTHSGFMLPGGDPEAIALAVQEFLRTPVDWYMHLAVTTSRHVRVSLRDIAVPTTFVAGTHDLLADAADMRSAADRIPGARYVELPASHFLGLERPDEVHQELLALLARVEDRASGAAAGGAGQA